MSQAEDLHQTLPTPLESEANSPEPVDPAIRFIMALGRALHEAGAPSDRLEDRLGKVASQLGLETEFFSTPTSLLSSMAWPGQEPRTIMIRVQPGQVNLGRLELVDHIAGQVATQHQRLYHGTRPSCNA